MPAKKNSLINWQLPMKRVLYALVPIALSGVYFFGWRALVVLLVANVAGFLSEAAFIRREGTPVTSAVFVTSSLFALSLPPLLPLWMVVVGIVFGVVFGKMVFGGFGRNIFNPALTGRAFIYISFGDYMTARCWTHPIDGVLGGLTSYANTAADAVTQATPGTWLNYTEAELAARGLDSSLLSLKMLFLGDTAGVIGGTSILLVALGGFYLVRSKAANWRLPLSVVAAYIVTQLLLILFGAAYDNAPPNTVDIASRAVRALRLTMASVCSGSLMFGAFFYATDPVSAPKSNEGRWLYGAAIGLLSALIGAFSVWPAGTMFAILFANMFAPITDYAITSAKQKARQT
jgi:Na+-transporting NADH:ubiquinone oxidoreductase subunit B